MNTARQPRKSGLARSGLSAVRPQETPSQTAATQAAPADTKQPKAKQQKVGFYQHPEDAARMRGCFEETRTKSREGDRSLSDFIQKAIMAEVERRETLYNNGQPFEAVYPGEGQIGRPEGS